MRYETFMNRPLELMQRIEHKIDDVAFKWTLCLNTTQGLSERVQSSPSNTQEASYLRYIDAKNDLNDLVAELETAQNEVRDFLYDSLSFNDADLLEWRYINGKSPQEIADRMGVTYEATRQRLKRANEKARQQYARREN